MNSGFKSRFTRFFDLPKLTTDDCVNLLIKQSSEEDFKLEKEAKDLLPKGFEEMIQFPGKAKKKIKHRYLKFAMKTF